MNEAASDDQIQNEVLTQENIEVLLGIVDVIEDLDEDEFMVVESLVRALPPDSIYDMRWFENKLEQQRMSSSPQA